MRGKKKIEAEMKTKMKSATRDLKRFTAGNEAKNAKRIVLAVLMLVILVGALMLTACKTAGIKTTDITDGSGIATDAFVTEIDKKLTATAAVTKPTQKITVTPKPTVKESVAETKVTEIEAMVATTKAASAPAATTKAADVTTAAAVAPSAATQTTAAATAAPPAETTAPTDGTIAAPATDYTAVCAEIRSKLIAILKANVQWDEAFAGESTKSGSQWWGVGFYDDGEMSTDDFAQHFYANKFSGRAICGTSITCYVADGNINIEYAAYWTS